MSRTCEEIEDGQVYEVVEYSACSGDQRFVLTVVRIVLPLGPRSLAVRPSPRVFDRVSVGFVGRRQVGGHRALHEVRVTADGVARVAVVAAMSVEAVVARCKARKAEQLQNTSEDLGLGFRRRQQQEPSRPVQSPS